MTTAWVSVKSLQSCPTIATPWTVAHQAPLSLGFITEIKASGGDEIPGELFQILKDDAVKSAALNLPANLENSSGHRTGKGQFSF